MRAIAGTTPKRGFQLSLQPALAWMAIIGLALLTLLLVVVGAGKILNYVFPAGAFLVGVFLYFRAPLLYTGFCWWIWFLAPLVRRLADFRGGGFTNPSPILLAPYLVTLVTLITLRKHLPTASRQGGMPFILAIIGTVYGLLIGVINKPVQTAVLGFLDWLPPVLFGFHLCVNWREYPSYRQNLERTFVWGTVVMGVYGVIQFLIAPEWDRFWLTNAEIVSSGKPEPLGLRVWSTMNSPEPFAAVMTAGLLLLFSTQSPVGFIASAGGYLSFLLTQVRSAWLGWLAGLLGMIGSLSPKFQMRMIITVLVMAICVVPLATIEPFSEVISERVSTLSDAQNDNSATIRQGNYEENLDKALTNVMGDGIGGGGFDSAVLTTLINLGWLGTIPYIGGMMLLVFKLFQSSEGKSDPFLGAVRAITLSNLVRFPVNGVTAEASGMVLWGFLGIGIAALKYHQHQQWLKNYQLKNEVNELDCSG